MGTCELLRKAINRQRLLESGTVANPAEIECKEGITPAMVTHLTGMPKLALEIREHILSRPGVVGRSPVTERVLRPIATIIDWHDHIRGFQKLSG